MRSDELVGHGAILEGLWRAAREERLAHALLFTGPRGLGKFLAAEHFTAGLLCTRGPGVPCRACGPCKRVHKDSHPDVFVVDVPLEANEAIRLRWIAPRENNPDDGEGKHGCIGEFLSLRPLEGGYRSVLVRSADRLTEEAQTALLKTLEEPGDRTVLVLETARPDRLLPTIHSRCVRVEFAPLAPEFVLGWLAARGMEPTHAGELARWARYAPGACLELEAARFGEMRTIVARLLDGEIDPFAVSPAVSLVEGEYGGKTPAASARHRARVFLDLCVGVVRDALAIEAGIAPDSLPQGDLARHFPPAGEALLRARLERCLEARQDVDSNLSPDSALERAALALEPRRAAARRA